MLWPLALVFLLAAIPSIVQQYEAKTGLLNATRPDRPGFWLTLMTPVLISLLTTPFVHGVATVMCLDNLRGARTSLSAAASVAAQAYPRMLGMYLCVVIGYMLGMIFLIIPGIMFAVACWVVTPSCMAEGLGPIESIKRSAALTKGYRWKLFGLALVLALLGGVVVAMFIPVGKLAGPLVGGVGQAIFGAVVGVFGIAVGSTTYIALREAREGMSTTRLAAVF